MSLKKKAANSGKFSAAELAEIDKITWSYDPVKYPAHAKMVIAQKKAGWIQNANNPNVWEFRP